LRQQPPFTLVWATFQLRGERHVAAMVIA